jgi:hypothetical protein
MKRYLNALERLLRDIPRLGGVVPRQLLQETEGYRSAANTMKPTDKPRRDTLNRAVKFAWLLVLIEGVALLAALYSRGQGPSSAGELAQGLRTEIAINLAPDPGSIGGQGHTSRQR